MYRTVHSSKPSHAVVGLPTKYNWGLRPTTSKFQGYRGVERVRVNCESTSSSDNSQDSEELSSLEAPVIPDKLPVAGVDTDWREFRARLVASSSSDGASTSSNDAGIWAHALPKPEKGCLLLAHPLMFATSQIYFQQAVIFLFEHGPRGSAGLILNKATEHAIGSLAGAEQLCPEFSDNILYLGGDVGKETVHLLHSFPELEGCIEVVNGVYMGGFEAAKLAVKEGRLCPQDFRWFTRYAGWAPGQLEGECESGVWFTAAACKGIVLPDAAISGRSMWHNILELMGGEFKELSSAVKGTYRPDIMGVKSTSDAENAQEQKE